MDDPEAWRWLWLVAAFGFAVGELASPGAFFLAPFALGAVVAAVLAFAGVGVGLEWLFFVIVSAGAFAALRPLSRRLDQTSPDGIGAKRLIGSSAVVVEAIPAGHGLGLVQVQREEWRAESVDGVAIAAGTPVKVVEVQGTRVVVWPTGLDMPLPIRPPESDTTP